MGEMPESVFKVQSST